jgi:hypothetical protein
MRINLRYILIIPLALGLISCSSKGPVKVEVALVNQQYTLTVDGKPFYVKGAGCEFGNMEALATHGANAIRTWRTDNGVHSGKEVLDEALKNGLLVCMGLEIGRERHGFNYDDPISVKKQFDYVKGEVLKYKDHPALLAWGIGNELNLNSSNPAVWDAVNNIAAMIHEVDPNHPATTMLAGFNKDLGDQLSLRCLDLDFLSFQFYADIVNLPKYLKEAGYAGPYLVTEWGATGHWESPMTSWGRPIEQNSFEKAEAYKYRYENVIAADKAHCMGSFVFLWGQKQERTPTWYGMFLENGDETASVDVMHYLWNGKWPDNQTPKMETLLLNGNPAQASVVLMPGQVGTAQVSCSDPDQDPLTITWEVIAEVAEGQQSDGGDFENRPKTVEIIFQNKGEKQVEFKAPTVLGEYRLFVYVSDGHGHSATANIPFLVK